MPLPRVFSRSESAQSRFASAMLVVVAVAALALAREVLIPIAMSLLLMFLLNPIVARLQRRLGNRPVAVAIVMLGAVMSVGSVTYIVGQQVIALAASIPAYQDTMLQKVRTFRQGMQGSVSEAAQAIGKIGTELGSQTMPATTSPATQPTSQPATSPDASSPRVAAPSPLPVTAATAPAVAASSADFDPLTLMAPLVPSVLSMFANSLIVALLLAMMLVSPESIRDPVIRLAGLRRISVTTQSLEEAGARVSAYLRALFLVNLFYGSGIAAGLFVIGVPGAVVCGVMAGLLRFVPIVGVWIGAALPVMLSIAAFEGWTPLVLVVALFVTLELINNFVLEPWLYRTSTGISSVGVVLALVFWTWIWGGTGLVLAMPLTVCLLVFARQFPQLSAFPILLGDQPALLEHARFYQRLLVNNEDEAAAILRGTAKEAKEGKDAKESKEPGSALDRVDAVIVPAFGALRHELSTGAISDEQAARVAQDIRDITIDWLGDQPVESAEPGESSPSSSEPTAAAPVAKSGSTLVACVPVNDLVDEFAAEVFAAALERAGAAAGARVGFGATVTALSRSWNDVAAEIAAKEPAIVCLSAIAPTSMVHLRRVCKLLRRKMPQTKIVACLWSGAKHNAANADAPATDATSGADADAFAFGDAVEAVTRMVGV